MSDEFKSKLRATFSNVVYGLLESWDVSTNREMDAHIADAAKAFSEEVPQPEVQESLVLESGEIEMVVRNFEFSTRRGGRLRVELERLEYGDNLGDLKKDGRAVLKIGGVKGD